MSRCLYVFDADPCDDAQAEELAECDLDDYCDFDLFCEMITRSIDTSRYPTLRKIWDCDGRWRPGEVAALERELREIEATFRELPAIVTRLTVERHTPNRARTESLYDWFKNAHGENLFAALLELCAVAREHEQPIIFM
jgi:hypothetical protein